MDNLGMQPIKGYELRGLIGQGGTGVVYRAYQPVVEREVAIKVIHPDFANHPDFIRRFNTEAQLIARLEHPFIVPLYDYWRDPDGAYLVMRYLRGGSLRDRLERSPLTLNEVLRLVEQMSSALMVAHRNGVVHRDLKPANILLDEEGNAFLADFGIAKVLAAPTDATQEEQLIGTPAYLSPEQIRCGPVTPSTDIYSLGIVVYETLSGKYPFPGDQLETLLIKQLKEPLPLLDTTRPDLPASLNDVLQRATAKDPAARYPDTLRKLPQRAV